jgi:hypothetical protein
VSTGGKIIGMLDLAERDLPHVKAIGDEAAKILREVRGTLDAVSAGIPDKELCKKVGDRSTAIESAFRAVSELEPEIRRAKADVARAFGR